LRESILESSRLLALQRAQTLKNKLLPKKSKPKKTDPIGQAYQPKPRLTPAKKIPAQIKSREQRQRMGRKIEGSERLPGSVGPLSLFPKPPG
jgi:hypothetical protein